MRDEIYTLEELRARVAPVAEKYKLPKVYVFGSYARGEATPESDVDLIVDRSGSTVHSLFDLGGLYNDLEEALEKPIDLVTEQTLEQPPSRHTDLLFRAEVRRERKEIYGTV